MVIFHSYVSLPQCKGNDSWSIKAYDMSGHLSPQEISRNPSLFHISFMHGKCALCKFIKPYQDYQANTCQYTIILRIPTLGLFCLTRGKYSERVKLCSDSEPVRVWVAFWILWVDAKEVSVTSPKWWIPSGNLTQLLKMTIYSGFSHKKIVIFHSYVSLPEGTSGARLQDFILFPVILLVPIHRYHPIPSLRSLSWFSYSRCMSPRGAFRPEEFESLLTLSHRIHVWYIC